MTRKYMPVLQELKKHSKAEITVSRDNMSTAIYEVKRLKSEDNMQRKALGLPRFSKLKITKKDIGRGLFLVTFEFLYEAHKL